MLERMAVVLCQTSFCRGTNMGEDQAGVSFGGQAFQVHAVPGRQRRREDARVGPKDGLGVPAYAEAVAIDRAAGVKAEAGVVGLG